MCVNCIYLILQFNVHNVNLDTIQSLIGSCVLSLLLSFGVMESVEKAEAGGKGSVVRVSQCPWYFLSLVSWIKFTNRHQAMLQEFQ